MINHLVKLVSIFSLSDKPLGLSHNPKGLKIFIFGVWFLIIMVDISKFDVELNTEILKELEKSYNEGRIDETTYIEAKKKYGKRLKDAQMGRDTSHAPFAVNASGSQTSTQDTLKFSGSATLAGGTVDKFIRISGSGRINGDIECNGIRSSGSLKSLGDMVLHGDLRSSGSFSSKGEIKSDGNAKFSASANIGKNLIVSGSVKSSGSFRCNGYLKTGSDIKMSGSSNIGDYIESSGFLKCSGSLNCGNQVIANDGVHLSGGTNIGGDLISAKHITITGMFEIGKNIEGNDISLNVADGLFEKKFFNRRKSTVEGSIRGLNRVEIDNTTVKGDIAGYNIIIGPRSIIKGKILYVNDIQINKKAEISTQPIQIQESELKDKLNLVDVERNDLFCPGCGDKIDKNNDTKFCPSCGYQYLA